MKNYIFKRLLGAILVIFLVSIISYAILYLAPGDPTELMISPHTLPQDRARIRANLGLDKPVYIQYIIWFKNIVIHGDLGYSLVNGRPVLNSILERLPATLLLMLTAYLISFLIAVPLGVISAVKQYSFYDYFLTFLSFLGLSAPSFWLGLMAIYFFALKLGWFPTTGITSYQAQNLWQSFLDISWHLVLPALVLAVRNLAGWTRYIRASMLDVINENYITTAYAKGLSKTTVIFKHALRNALLPVITLLGLSLPEITSGAFVIEYIFGWPGMGRLGMEAVFHRDYTILMGDILLASVMVILGNLLADILYALADPRIKYTTKD